jgi:hypothetical protein
LISDALVQFIRTNIKSVWALELLLLVCREPARSWSPGQINSELHCRIGLVNDILRWFKDRELITEESGGQYRCDPNSPEARARVKELQVAYAERPLAVFNIVVESTNAHIQAFSDAFKLKKD